MELTILILVCLILLLLCLNLAFKTNIPERISDLKTNKKEKEEKTKEELNLAFKNGAEHAWSLVQLSLFKMYNENEILDFDSIREAISKNVVDLSTNQEQLLQWHNKFMKYANKNENENESED